MATVTTSSEVKHKLSPVTWIAIALVVIGALNWGLVGLFKFNLVAAIFGELSALSRIIYILVALSGIYLLVDAFRMTEEQRRGATA